MKIKFLIIWHEHPIYDQSSGFRQGKIVTIEFEDDLFDYIAECLFLSMDSEAEGYLNFVVFDDSDKPKRPKRYSIENIGNEYSLIPDGERDDWRECACMAFSLLDAVGSDELWDSHRIIRSSTIEILPIVYESLNYDFIILKKRIKRIIHMFYKMLFKKSK